MKSTTQAADNLINEMEADSGKAIAELATPTPTRRRAMFFEKVGGGKEIPFKTTIILCRLDPKGDYFTTGTLVSKTETAEGFQYLFNDNQVCKDCFQENNPVKFDYWLQPVVQ